MSAPQHLMLDIETLGTRPGFVVMSAAVVRFSDMALTSVNISIPDQQALGIEIDPATHAWWGTQPAEAWAAATQNPLPLRDALDYLAQWIRQAGGADSFVWCHGASFDAPMLGEVYRRAGIATPWTFRQVRDTRTLYQLAGIDLAKYGDGANHVALSDAKAQTLAAIDALRILARAHAT